MDTAKKNLICILILLTISTVISIRTDKMTKVQTDLYQSGENCNKTNAWSSDIANGRVAPWTYAGGQEVTNNGNLFRAMWGGTEVPGEKICSTEADCRNKGWQWMIVGTCSQEEPVNSICNGKNEWSVDIANGRKAPWTYLGGAQVTHNGALYKAMWGGSEVPGTHVCRTDGECRNNGWQWMTEGQC